MSELRFLQGHVLDTLRGLPDESVHCVVTSPPYYGLRDYGIEGCVWDSDPDCQHDFGQGYTHTFTGAPGSNKQASNRGANGVTVSASTCLLCGAWRGSLGLEPTVDLYVSHIVQVFREVRRVLRRDGTLWLNIGDSYVAGPAGHQDISNANGKAAAMFAKGGRYRVDNLRKDTPRAKAGLKPKDLCLIPERLAIALQDDGWWIRSRIAWCKRAPMPESVRDRPTSAWEHVWLITKSERYFYDADAVRQAPLPESIQRAQYAYPDTNKGDGRGNERSDGGTVMANGFTDYHLNPAGRNLWNYWLLSPESFAEAHFATYPTEIPRRAIKAGTSEWGVCAECGSPWRRVVERTPMVIARSDRQELMGEYGRTQASGTMVSPARADTTGWQPTCPHHDAPRVPATVLDPFSGAGTTGLVAVELGRDYVGCELNPEYIEMSKRRIMGQYPLFAYQSLEEQPA